MPADKSYSKNGTVRARISNEARARLDQINARHRTNDSQIVSALVDAFVEVVEAEDAIRFPITILLAEKHRLLVAEDNPAVDKPPRAPDKSQRHRGDGPRRAVS